MSNSLLQNGTLAKCLLYSLPSPLTVGRAPKTTTTTMMIMMIRNSKTRTRNADNAEEGKEGGRREGLFYEEESGETEYYGGQSVTLVPLQVLSHHCPLSILFGQARERTSSAFVMLFTPSVRGLDSHAQLMPRSTHQLRWYGLPPPLIPDA